MDTWCCSSDLGACSCVSCYPCRILWTSTTTTKIRLLDVRTHCSNPLQSAAHLPYMNSLPRFGILSWDPDQDSNHPKRVLSSVHTRQASCLSDCLTEPYWLKHIKHVWHWVSCFYWRRRRKVCKAGPVMFEETLFQWAAGSHRYKELQFHVDRLGSLCWSQRDQSGQGPATRQADGRYVSILLYGTWSFPVMPPSGQFCQTIQSDGSGCVFLRARCSDVRYAAFVLMVVQALFAKLLSRRLERNCDPLWRCAKAWSTLPEVEPEVVFHMFHKCEKRMQCLVSMVKLAPKNVLSDWSTIHIHRCKDILTLENENTKIYKNTVRIIMYCIMCVILLFSLNACHACFWGGIELSLIWRLSRTSRLRKFKTLEHQKPSHGVGVIKIQDFNIFQQV